VKPSGNAWFCLVLERHKTDDKNGKQNKELITEVDPQ